MSDTNIEFWDKKHESGETPWQLNVPSPPIMEYIAQLKDKSLKILIPGAGQGFELDHLLNLGFTNIDVCDIAPHAIEGLKKRIGTDKAVNYITGDFFDLDGQYDLIIEQTFFCAINPTLRERYVNKMYDLLNNNGKLVGLLFASHFATDGPPFGGNKSQYKELFQQKLHITIMEMCYNSVKPRHDNELFFICKKIAN